MVLVPKRESKPASDDRPEDPRFHGMCREKISQSSEGVDRRWHTGNPRRDATIKRGLQADMVHQCGSQLPVKAEQGDTAAQFIQGPGALTPYIEYVNGNALARDVFQTGLSWHGDMDVEAGLP